MTSISTLGQTLTQIERFKTMQAGLNDLEYQLATGKKTNMFKGLGTDVIASQRARATVTSLESYRSNIAIADRRMTMMTNAMDSFRVQAENIANGLQIQTQEGEFEIDSLSGLADNTFDFMVDLLNLKDGDRYLFGGSGTQDMPIQNSGTHDTYLNSQVNNWINGTMTTDELIASYRDRTQLNDTAVGYSVTLSSGDVRHVYARVDDYSELDYTVLANDDAFRDVLVATNMIRSLTENLDEITRESDDPVSLVTAPGATQDEQNDNFYQVFNDLSLMLNDALDRLTNVQFSFSQTQAQMAQIDSAHESEQNILETTISEIEDADMNEVAVKLNALQIQMDASYRVTAALSELSLVNYI